jgi:phospholipid/cholesterol/gamma-HCH transport system substrate-binding protein
LTTRVVAIVALVLATVLLIVVLTGGGNTHTYSMEFQNAGQLVKDDDVQVGGRRIGSIRKIELTSDNQAKVEIEVQEPYAPLHEGTKGIIRATSLSGVANRYIALTPGPQSNRKLDDRATLTQDSTTTIVDLDQLFNTLDAPTRKNLQTVIQSFATQYRGKSAQAGRAAEYFNPALSTSRRLFDELTSNELVLTKFLVNSSRTVSALADKRNDISSSISNTNQTASAIAAESQSLSQALNVLPTTLKKANTTFVNLRSTLDDLDVLVDASKPATKNLAPFLRELRPLVRDARPTIAELRVLLHRNGADNDLVDATRKLPAFEKKARPALSASTAALKRAQPVLEFLRPYTPDFVGWLRDFGEGANTYDANGHYARIMPMTGAYAFTDNPTGGSLVEQPIQDRLNQLLRGQMERCPGAATQPAPDGSNPYKPADFPADGCKPEQVPPGP